MFINQNAFIAEDKKSKIAAAYFVKPRVIITFHYRLEFSGSPCVSWAY
jgi:hypothetical protein